jgi:nucleoside-diphosphate-sugar epimerase
VIAERCVVVTGAGGFVGRHLVSELLRRGVTVRALVRSQASAPHTRHAALEIREVADIVGARWDELLSGAGAIVHLAALAHRGNPRSADEAHRVRAVNVGAVTELTRAARAAQVRRLVLLSSIGVLGASSGDQPFDGASIPAPHDFYSRTKLDAELAAQDTRAGSPLELCVVRAPLVFGPDAPGNFGRLVTAIRRGMPLPLGAVDNRRSLISVWNLCDLLITCLTHPGASGVPLLAADDEVISTAQLVRQCAACLHVRPRLIRVPVRLLKPACELLGRRADFERLCGSLVVDTRYTQERLGWRPPLDLQEGVRQAIAGSRLMGTNDRPSQSVV